MLLFLGHLRQLLWSRRAVALLCLPSALHPSASVGRLLAHGAHAALSLASFADAGGPGVQAVALQALGDYDGLLRLEKAPTLHALAPALGVAAHVAPQDTATSGGSTGGAGSGATSSFLYKCARRRILIEKFALPPEMDDTATAAPAAAGSAATPADTMALEHAARASKPASLRSTRPPPSMLASASAAAASVAQPAAAAQQRGRIELGLEHDDDGSSDAQQLDASGSLRGSSASLSRRPGAEPDQKPDPRRAKAHAHNDALQAIVRGRAMGCSGTHQLPGKMDF